MSYLERDTCNNYKTHNNPGPYLMGIDTLTGENVVNHKAEELGSIREIMLDMRTGEVTYAILSFGIFITGEKLFAVPWVALTLDATNKPFVVPVEKDRFVHAPSFEKDAWPDMKNSVDQ